MDKNVTKLCLAVNFEIVSRSWHFTKYQCWQKKCNFWICFSISYHNTVNTWRVVENGSPRYQSKHQEIAKGCTMNISSVVEVSSSSNQKTFGQKFGFLRTWFFFSFVRILVFSFIRTTVFEFCFNLSFWILPQFVFLSVIIIWILKLCQNLIFLFCHIL